MADSQSIIGKGAIFKGKITNATTIEINGRVEADIKSDKVTLGKNATLEGSIASELVVISGNYQGKLKLTRFGLLIHQLLLEKLIINPFKWIEEQL